MMSKSIMSALRPLRCSVQQIARCKSSLSAAAAAQQQGVTIVVEDKSLTPDEAMKVKGKHIFNAQYDWSDAFDLKSQLTEEEILIRDTAHAYAQEALLPRIL